MKKTIVTTTYVLFYLVLFWSLSSCTNFRYTNYGKPFDFLKAKKYHSKTTISYDLSEESKPSTPKVINIHKIDTISFAEEQKNTPCDSLQKDIKEINTRNVKKEFRSINNTSKNRFLTYRGISEPIKKLKNSTLENDVPEWLSNAMNAVWRFFLKWVLISILVLGLLILLIWGIYELVYLIGGSLVAAIVLILILIALQIFTGIDLFSVMSLII